MGEPRLAVVFAVANVFAGAAGADCDVVRPPDVFSFDGRTVPRNAELRFSSFGKTLEFDLVGPGGAVSFSVSGDGASDFDHGIVADLPLEPGEYTLTRLDEEARVVAFRVDDSVDDDAPAAPTVSVRQETGGNPVSFLFDNCGDPWPTDTVHFVVDSDGDTGGICVDEGCVATTSGHNVFARREADGGSVSYDVVVRDLAGNESEATTATVWSGCPGGCASTSALPITAVLLLLLRRPAGASLRRR